METENYRRKYLKDLDGGKRLTETDALAIILGNAFNGRDMRTQAENILKCFPSIRAAAEASVGELTAVAGVSQSVALYLKALDRVFNSGSVVGSVMSCTGDCINYMHKRFAKEDNEHFEFYCIDYNGKVVDVRTYTSEMVDKVEVSARDIMAVLATTGASGIYLAHNHVNAPAHPSGADDKTTLKVAVACRLCGLNFFDHCIVNLQGESFSYRKSGRLKKLENDLNI